MARIVAGWMVDDDWPGGPEDHDTPGAPRDRGFQAVHMLSGCTVSWRRWPDPEWGWLKDGSVWFVPNTGTGERILSGPLDSVSARRFLDDLVHGREATG